jgi:hypothetical protein
VTSQVKSIVLTSAADEVLASLTRLAGKTTPSQLIATREGLAHDLAKRFLPVSSPSIRGTLDPRRTHALHDNATLRIRPPPPATLSLGTPSLPSSSRVPQGYMSPGLPSATSAQAGTSRYIPYGRPSPSQTASTPTYSPRYQNPPNPSPSVFRPTAPPTYIPQANTGNNIYSRQGASGVATPAAAPAANAAVNGNVNVTSRLGPGPSTLRQSFGPGNNPGLFGAIPLGRGRG